MLYTKEEYYEQKRNKTITSKSRTFNKTDDVIVQVDSWLCIQTLLNMLTT